ncbi:MAG: 3-hydroxymyristoyl/3-hydroxydecanoyl-(acyl carrier protein) dehydratase [Planctomycetota bacterium]|jgi:3-hydroxymyristoyl/3-hydroxydecanoyl-(acyl carrier protein) dehydratase
MRKEVAESFVSTEPRESGLHAVFSFSPELSVFVGHFPGNPLVPGVYLVEALRQVVARALRQDLSIAEIKMSDSPRRYCPISP